MKKTPHSCLHPKRGHPRAEGLMTPCSQLSGGLALVSLGTTVATRLAKLGGQRSDHLRTNHRLRWPSTFPGNPHRCRYDPLRRAAVLPHRLRRTLDAVHAVGWWTILVIQGIRPYNSAPQSAGG